MTIFSDKKIYVIDGAMGTQIMKRVKDPGLCFEGLNLSHPEIIQAIHKDYVDAGSNMIETNTFGATMVKLKAHGLEGKFHKINFDAVRLAKKAAARKALVAASMGPCGELLEPIGKFSFDEAYEEFAAQAKVFEEAGADLVSIETMSDLQEARAALIAVKQNTNLPVIVHMTYSENGKTNTGTPPEVAAAVLGSLGTDAIGANCSSGPQGLIEIAKRLIKSTDIPISIMPNAGNPEVVDDETVYRMTPEKFAPYAREFAKIGVKFIGGCCGTSPEHIKAIVEAVRARGRVPQHGRAPKQGTTLTSRTQVLEFKPGRLMIIGERINPTNRKDLQQELREGKSNIIRQNAVSQVAAGADILDVNVGAPDIDEKAAIKRAVHAVQASVEVPVCIDSSDPAVIEEGLKNYCGKALINSVNGKKESLDAVIPLAKKYGAAVIGLTLEKGIPSKASERIKIAKKIIDRAVKAGVNKQDIFIDTLVLAAGAQQEDVKDTLVAVEQCKTKLKVMTSLGVSNVSHGLPNRKALNSVFLKLCQNKGLDAAIYNPENLKYKVPLSVARDAEAVFLNRDKGAKDWIKKYSSQGSVGSRHEKAEAPQKRNIEKIFDVVVQGNKDIIVDLIETEIQTAKPQNVIDKALLPAMEEVGKRFNDGRYFIPQVMASAETMKTAFERVKKEIKPEDVRIIGTAVIATVLGDIHDIGKNIVAMLLENHGFKVIDLGKDVSPELTVKTARDNKADVILLSALLTTTMPQMKVVKQLLDKEGVNIPVLIGGAPVTENFANSFSANFARDAIAAVERAKNLLTS